MSNKKRTSLHRYMNTKEDSMSIYLKDVRKKSKKNE